MEIPYKYGKLDQKNKPAIFIELLKNKKIIKNGFDDDEDFSTWKSIDDKLYIYNNRKEKIHEFTYDEEISKNQKVESMCFIEKQDDDEKKILTFAKKYFDLYPKSTKVIESDAIKRGIITSVGDHTYGKFSLPEITLEKQIEIGDYTSFADNVVIILQNHNTSNITTYPFDTLSMYNFGKRIITRNHITKNKLLKIGNDVWIGQDVIILPGVTEIGDGAVIAARSVVTKNVKPYSIVAGIPAKHIKYRFTKKQIEELLRIKWWDWDDKTVEERIKDISTDNIEEFINKYKKEN